MITHGWREHDARLAVDDRNVDGEIARGVSERHRAGVDRMTFGNNGRRKGDELVQHSGIRRHGQRRRRRARELEIRDDRIVIRDALRAVRIVTERLWEIGVRAAPLQARRRWNHVRGNEHVIEFLGAAVKDV